MDPTIHHNMHVGSKIDIEPAPIHPHSTHQSQLGHLKRVRRDRATGALAAILSTPDRYKALEVSAVGLVDVD